MDQLFLGLIVYSLDQPSVHILGLSGLVIIGVLP